MKLRKNRKLRGLFIALIVIGVLLLFSMTPVYPARASHTADNLTLVALTFDDGYDCWTSEIMPILEEYGLPASGYITDPAYRDDFTWTDAQRLNDAGWEIGWHTANHLSADTATQVEMEDDFSSAKPLFESHGLPSPTTFAYPAGRHDSESIEIASEYFLASRTMHDGVNSAGDVQNSPHHLKQYSLEKGLPFLENKVNKYAQKGMFVVFAGHTVGQVAKWQTEPDMTVADFRNLAQFLYEKQQAGLIKVVTFDEGVKLMKARNVTYAWRIEIESPFDTWFNFWVIPVPERYYIFYQSVVQDFVGHRYPGVARWFDRF